MDTEHWIDQLDPVSEALYQSQVAIIFFMMKMMIDDNKIKHNKIPTEMDIAPRYTLWHHDIANTAQTACNAFTSGDTPETVTSTRAPAVLITFVAIKGLDEWPHVDLKTLEGGGWVWWKWGERKMVIVVGVLWSWLYILVTIPTFQYIGHTCLPTKTLHLTKKQKWGLFLGAFIMIVSK